MRHKKNKPNRPIVVASYTASPNIMNLAKSAFEGTGMDMTDPKNIHSCEEYAHQLFMYCADRIADDFGFEWEWEYSNDYDEPDNIDDDCGFDPYMGCFSDDC